MVVDTQGPNPKLIDALSQASSLELFHLSTIINRMLANPRRIIAVRLRMHLGQTVRLLDWHDGRMRIDKIVPCATTRSWLSHSTARPTGKALYGGRTVSVLMRSDLGLGAE